MTTHSHIPPPLLLRSNSAADVAQFCREVAKKIGQPGLSVIASVAGQSAGARLVSFQVVNCVNQPVTGRFLVHAYVATSAGGDPGGTQTVAFVTGDVLETLDPMVRWNVLTESDGTFSFTLTAAAGQTRVCHAVAMGVAAPSDEAVFT